MNSNLGKYLTIASFIFVSSYAAAQEHTGNGGDMLRLNGRDYLLDFAEAGIQANPIFGHSKIDPKDLTTLKTKFSSYPLLQQLVGEKVAEIHGLSPLFSRILMGVLRNYDFAFVDAPLKVIHDAHTHLKFPKSSLYQVAVRDGFRIQMNRAAFNLLSSSNQAGLIFHEVLYAMSSNQDDSDGIRALNGLLFSRIATEIDGDLFARAFGDAQIDFNPGDQLKRVKKQALTFASTDISIHTSYVSRYASGQDYEWTNLSSTEPRSDFVRECIYYRNQSWEEKSEVSLDAFIQKTCSVLTNPYDPLIKSTKVTVVLNPAIFLSGFLGAKGFEFHNYSYDYQVTRYPSVDSSTQNCEKELSQKIKDYRTELQSELEEI